MAFRRRLAQFNRRITNPVLGTLAPYVPPMAVVVHRGRRSGRLYRTPVLSFPVDGGYAIALFYGRDTDWVRNVRAAQRCTLQRRGGEVALTDPVILDRDALNLLPSVLHPMLRLINTTEVLRLNAAPRT